MRRKPLTLVVAFLILLSTLIAGCRRSAIPTIDVLVPEDEALAAIQEASSNTEGLQPVSPETDAPVAEAPGEDELPADPTEEAVESSDPVAPAPTSPGQTTAPADAVTAPATGEPGIHVVQPGENLFRIALRYDTTVAAITQANNITNPSMLTVGQRLTIPTASGTGAPAPAPAVGGSCSTTYTVRPGDNLFRIALRYNHSQHYLAQANGISNPAMIQVGQVLCIP